MLNSAVANSRERFPKSNGVVIASCKERFSLQIIPSEVCPREAGACVGLLPVQSITLIVRVCE